MFGIDVSSYQRAIDFRREKFDFCIVKATEGYDYTSPSFRYFVDELTKLDKLIGVYHFARPDKHSSVAHMKREADHFVKKIDEAGLIGKAVLALDWEKEPTIRPDLVEAFMSRVTALTFVRPFLYASKYILKSPEFKDIVKMCPLWMAQWPTKAAITTADVDDYITEHMPEKNPVNWTIWQFTDSGCWRGYQGLVDYDWADMTAEQWKNYATSAKKNTSSAGHENLSDDMAWAVANGLFKGYGDGRYGPTDYLTRDQMARVLRRYTKYIVGQIQKAIENS